MATVGLTGGTGHLGSLLVDRLLAEPDVEVVRSVARRPLRWADPRLRHVQADLSDPAAVAALRNVDICYHLGFQLWQAGSVAEMAAANRAGTATVVAAAPGAVVLVSSAAVYGAWPSNPLPLDEDHLVRPNPECPYAGQKLEAERSLCAAAPTVVLRLGAVLGAHADAAVARSARGYRIAVPAVRGVAQAVQFIDEGDAVDAVVATGRVHAGGLLAGQVLNVATDDWLSAPEIAALAGSRVLALPRRVLLGVSETAHRSRLLPFGSDRSVLVCGPLALSSARAATVLGWSARRSSAQVLATALGRPAPGGPAPGGSAPGGPAPGGSAPGGSAPGGSASGAPASGAPAASGATSVRRGVGRGATPGSGGPPWLRADR